MGTFHIALFLATLSCSLVAGFLFAFAVVVMPGLGNQADRDFIRGFQVIDRVIQNRQPIFMLVWAGSVVTLVMSVILGIEPLDRPDRLLLIFATVVYLLGVQLPTAIINIPLNNQLQTLDVAALDKAALKAAREEFEPRWKRWNTFRTVLAVLTTALLLMRIYGL